MERKIINLKIGAEGSMPWNVIERKARIENNRKA